MTKIKGHFYSLSHSTPSNPFKLGACAPRRVHFLLDPGGRVYRLGEHFCRIHSGSFAAISYWGIIFLLVNFSTYKKPYFQEKKLQTGNQGFKKASGRSCF